ncbi:MAG: sensor histidine kinase, partial [Chloroflexi bacterium]|nr:sensor histidine kinase [Chloroflexota bacterium]
NQDITVRKSTEFERMQAEKRLKQLTQRLITIQEAERKRISQDLHDDIGQSMTVLLLRLTAILNSAGSETKEIEPKLLDVIRTVELLMNHTRQLARQLHPPPLDSVPLPKALESLCSSFSQDAKLYVDFSSDKDLPPIPPLQATVLYRLVQEGLNNVVKYARATSVWINLDYIDGEVSLSLEDNGRGFDLNGIENGMGLRGLEERFRLLNGRFEIESTSEDGTRICGFLPLADHSL